MKNRQWNFGSVLMAGFSGFAVLFIYVSGRLYGPDPGFPWAYGVCAALFIVACITQLVIWNKK